MFNQYIVILINTARRSSERYCGVMMKERIMTSWLNDLRMSQ